MLAEVAVDGKSLLDEMGFEVDFCVMRVAMEPA